jgi:hypothetical protein
MPVKRGSEDVPQPEAKNRLSLLVADKHTRTREETTRSAKRMSRKTTKATSVLVRKKSSPSVSTRTKKATATKKPGTVTRTAKKAPQVSDANTPTEFSVTLPDRVSVRAQEKVLAILSTISVDFKRAAEQVSYVAGFCFIVLGGYVALSFAQVLPESLTPQSAQIIDTTTLPRTTTQHPVVQKPTITLNDPLPPVATEVSKHTIQVTNGSLENAFLYAEATGDRIDAIIEEVVPQTYRLVIDPSTLVPSRYIVKLRLEAPDDSKHVFELGNFSVLPPPTTASVAATSTDETVDTDEDEETEEEEVQTVDEIEEIDDVPPPQKDFVAVALPAASLSGRVVISIAAPATARTVEVYVRPINSATKRFVGLAEKRDGVWKYFLDTKNIPNGEYEVVARTKIGDSFIEGSSVRTPIINFAPTPTFSEEELGDDIDPIEPEIKIDPENGRSFSEVTLGEEVFVGDDSSASSSESFDQDIVVDTVRGQRERIEEIFKRYAVARQSEDPLLLKLADEELAAIRNDIVKDALSDPELADLGDDINASLATEFDDIKKRIDTFEELRRTATERSSAVDRDKDGVADFDEENLYQTDPDRPDTDNDGVVDGVEIMRGFDPLNPAAEAIIEYEMPQDTVGLVEETLLNVSAVVPVLTTTDKTLPPRVQAEIRGKGLPNSFVTVYVFSEPVIATIRTDEDGSFVYTFEKELEDGEHNVYVAITDNTGAIMAKSKPFTFIKEAEAFTQPSIDAPVDTSIASFNEAGKGYAIAIGLGLFTFGLILLVLGATLRDRSTISMTTPRNDVKAT